MKLNTKSEKQHRELCQNSDLEFRREAEKQRSLRRAATKFRRRAEKFEASSSERRRSVLRQRGLRPGF